MEILHRQGEIIGGRYQIVTTLGQGGMATTYAAVDLTNSQRVALKVVSLRQASDWKVLELFEREAKVLANLHHPFIPQYLDYFELDTKDDRRFYLIQELVAGESLAALVNRNWHATEAEVKDIAIQLLDILVYLHSLAPPVIHRDIKPQNIIRRGDGKVYLVDFGAVQAVYRNTISVSGTFVGTLGYMSPEQLRSNVVPASDLYSLGCSLIFLLTGKSPTDLPQKRMKIDVQSQVSISPNFANWLDKILEPATEDRFQSASLALTALKHNQQLKLHHKSAISQPISDRIMIDRQANNLKIKIAAKGSGCSNYFLVFWGLIWSSGWAAALYSSGQPILALPLMFGITILSSAIAGIWYEPKKRTSLVINPQTFNLQWTSFNLAKGLVKKQIQGNTVDIDWVNTNVDIRKTKTKNGTRTDTVHTCAISEGDREHKFGKGYQLSRNEVDWLTQEISAFLKQIRRS